MMKLSKLLPWFLLILTVAYILYSNVSEDKTIEEIEKTWLAKESEYKRVVSLLEASNEIFMARASREENLRIDLENTLDSLKTKRDEIHIKPIPINSGDVANEISNRIERSIRERDTIPIQ